MHRYISSAARLSVVAFVVAGIVGISPVFGDESDDDKKKNNSGEGVADDCGQSRNNCVEARQGSQDSFQTNGQVLTINSLKEPPELVIANVDGLMVVKLVGKEGPFLIKSSGVRLGQHVQVFGTKISEVEFWADGVTVDDNDNN